MSAVKAERIVNKKQLAGLVKEAKSVRDRTSSITGTFGERVAAAVENGNLDKKAFGVVTGLAKMKDEAARDRAIRNIPLYIDMLREEGLFPAEHVGDLADMASEGEGDGEDADDGDHEPAENPAAASGNGKEFAEAALSAMGEAPGSYTLKN